MAQAELFETKQSEDGSGVPGFWLRRNYIGAEQEMELLAQVENGPWETDWRRRIQQYGLGYSGESGKAKWVRDLPEWLCRWRSEWHEMRGLNGFRRIV